MCIHVLRPISLSLSVSLSPPPLPISTPGSDRFHFYIWTPSIRFFSCFSWALSFSSARSFGASARAARERGKKGREKRRQGQSFRPLVLGLASVWLLCIGCRLRSAYASRTCCANVDEKGEKSTWHRRVVGLACRQPFFHNPLTVLSCKNSSMNTARRW